MENYDLDIKNLEFNSEDTGYIYPKTYKEKLEELKKANNNAE